MGLPPYHQAACVRLQCGRTFVRPGAYRVATTGSVASVGLAAIKNTDGSVAAVFTNTGASAQSIKIAVSGLDATAATAYSMDNSHAVAKTTPMLSGGVPAHAVVTVVLTGESGESA